MRKNWAEILFWGGCWGLMEASLGYVIHFFSVPVPGLPGFLLFPAAFIVMTKAVESTHKKDIVLQMSLIAAGLKLLDFLIPGNDPIRIINPALSMMMEGSAVYAVYWISNRSTLVTNFTMGVLWRGIFLGYMVLISQFGLPAGLVTNGLGIALQFLVMESAINALIMSAYIQIDTVHIQIHPKWQLAASVCVLAVALQWII
jgi:hypothetical protein